MKKPIPQGAILLFTVIIFGFAVTMGLIVSSKSAVTSLGNAFDQTTATQSRNQLYSCYDEILFQLQRDADYDPGTLTVDGATCTVTITDLGGNERNISIETSNVPVSKSLSINMSLSPIIVNSIQEN